MLSGPELAEKITQAITTPNIAPAVLQTIKDNWEHISTALVNYLNAKEFADLHQLIDDVRTNPNPAKFSVYPSEILNFCQIPFEDLPITVVDGTVVSDNSVNGNSLTLHGGLSRTRGVSGWGLQFNGTNGSATGSFGSVSTMDFISLSWWEGFSAFSSTEKMLFQSDNSAGSAGLLGTGGISISINQGGIPGRLSFRIRTQTSYFGGHYDYLTTGLHHVGFVYNRTSQDNSSISVYIDGAPINLVMDYPFKALPFASSGTLPQVNNGAFYLHSKQGTSMFADGWVDEFRVDDAVLTPTNMKALYTFAGRGPRGLTGASGISPTSYRVNTSVATVALNSDGTYNPTTIVFSAFQTGGGTPPGTYSGIFKVYKNGTLAVTSAVVSTYTYTVTSAPVTTSIKVELWDSTGTNILDSQTVPILVLGAINGLLTNESITFPADNSGTVSSVLPMVSAGQFNVYNGLTQVTTGVTYAVGTITPASSSTVSINSSTGYYDVNTFPPAYNLSNITLTATFTPVGTVTPVVVTKILTLSKGVAGATGTSGLPTINWMYDTNGSTPIAVTTSSSIISKGPADSIGKTGGTTGYNVGLYSNENYTSGASINFNVADTSSTFAIGLDSAPIGVNYTTNGFNLIDYCFVFNGTAGTYKIYQSGTDKTTTYTGSATVAYSAGANFTITYVGTSVTFAHNGTTKGTQIGLGSSLQFYINGAFNSTASLSYPLAKIYFSPGSVSGPAGNAGTNTAPVFLYQRSATTPVLTDIPVTTTFTFTTGVLTGSPNLGAWSQSPPASTGTPPNPVWVTTNVASAVAPNAGVTPTANIISSTTPWTTPVKYIQDGALSALVFLYQASATPIVSTGFTTPTNDTVYTFATQGLTGTLGAWSTTRPLGLLPVYSTSALAYSAGTTATILGTSWTTPILSVGPAVYPNDALLHSRNSFDDIPNLITTPDLPTITDQAQLTTIYPVSDSGLVFKLAMDDMPPLPNNPVGIAYQNDPAWTGWAGTNCTLTRTSSGTLLYTSTTIDPYVQLTLPTPFIGPKYIIFRMKQVGVNIQPVIGVAVYANSAGIYKQTVVNNSGLGIWQTVVIDMTTVTSGGAWLGTSISQIRFDIPNNANHSPYTVEISNLYIGDGTYQTVNTSYQENFTNGVPATWISYSGTTPTVTGGILSTTKTGAGFSTTGGNVINTKIGDIVRVKIRVSSGTPDAGTLIFYNGVGNYITNAPIDGTWYIATFTMTFNSNTSVSTNGSLYFGTYFSTNPYTIEIGWIDISDGVLVSDSSLTSFKMSNNQIGIFKDEGPNAPAINFLNGGALHSVSESGLPMGNSPRTISAWVKCYGYSTSGYTGILTWGAGAIGNLSSFAITNAGALFFRVYGMNIQSSFIPYMDGLWHHVVATVSTTASVLYVDGVAIVTGSGMSIMNTTPSGGLWIGTEFGTAGLQFQGSIAYPMIWSRYLNNREVYSLYQRGIVTGAFYTSNFSTMDGWASDIPDTTVTQGVMRINSVANTGGLRKVFTSTQMVGKQLFIRYRLVSGTITGTTINAGLYTAGELYGNGGSFATAVFNGSWNTTVISLPNFVQSALAPDLAGYIEIILSFGTWSAQTNTIEVSSIVVGDGSYSWNIGDGSGNGGFLIPKGGVSRVAGITGSALSFDGLTGRARGVLSGASDKIQVSFWENFATFDTTVRELFEVGSGAVSNPGSLGLTINSSGVSGRLIATLVTTSGGALVSGYYNLPSAGWHHLSLSYDKGIVTQDALKLYVDGLLVSLVPVGTDTTRPDVYNDKFFLHSRDGSSLFAGGAVDDFRIDLTTLSQENVKALATQVPTIPQTVSTSVATLKSLAYLDLVESAKLGSTVVDGGYLKTELIGVNYLVSGMTPDAPKMIEWLEFNYSIPSTPTYKWSQFPPASSSVSGTTSALPMVLNGFALPLATAYDSTLKRGTLPFIGSLSQTLSTPTADTRIGSAFNPTTTPVSLMFWVKVLNVSVKQYVASFGATDGGTSGAVGVGVYGGRWRLGAYNDAISNAGTLVAPVVAEATAVNNTWTHIALVINTTSTPAVIQLWVNGVLIETKANVTSYTPGPLQYGGFAGLYFTGSLAGVTIFNKVLTKSEISANAVSYSGGKTIISGDQISTGAIQSAQFETYTNTVDGKAKTKMDLDGGLIQQHISSGSPSNETIITIGKDGANKKFNVSYGGASVFDVAPATGIVTMGDTTGVKPYVKFDPAGSGSLTIKGTLTVDSIAPVAYPADTGLSFRLPLDDLSYYPNGVALEANDTWATSNGWYIGGGPGALVPAGTYISLTNPAPFGTYMAKSIASGALTSGYVILKARQQVGTTLAHLRVDAVGSGSLVYPYDNALTNSWKVFQYKWSGGAISLVQILLQEYTTIGGTLDIDWIYVGSGAYASTYQLLDVSPNAYRPVAQTGVIRTEGPKGVAIDTTYGYVRTSEVGLPIGSSPRSMAIDILGSSGTIGTGFSYIMGYGASSFNNAFLLYHISTTFICESFGGAGLYFSDTGLLDGNWHSIVITYNGTTLKGYVDGVFKAQNTITLNTLEGPGLGIGNFTFDPSPSWKGQLGYPQIWARELTASEANALYVLGRPANTSSYTLNNKVITAPLIAPKYRGLVYSASAPTTASVTLNTWTFGTNGNQNGYTTASTPTTLNTNDYILYCVLGGTTADIYQWDGFSYTINNATTFTQNANSDIMGWVSGGGTPTSGWNFIKNLMSDSIVSNNLNVGVIRSLGASSYSKSSVSYKTEMDLTNARFRLFSNVARLVGGGFSESIITLDSNGLSGSHDGIQNFFVDSQGQIGAGTTSSTDTLNSGLIISKLQGAIYPKTIIQGEMDVGPIAIHSDFDSRTWTTLYGSYTSSDIYICIGALGYGYLQPLAGAGMATLDQDTRAEGYMMITTFPGFVGTPYQVKITKIDVPGYTTPQSYVITWMDSIHKSGITGTITISNSGITPLGYTGWIYNKGQYFNQDTTITAHGKQKRYPVSVAGRIFDTYRFIIVPSPGTVNLQWLDTQDIFVYQQYALGTITIPNAGASGVDQYIVLESDSNASTPTGRMITWAYASSPIYWPKAGRIRLSGGTWGWLVQEYTPGAFTGFNAPGDATNPISDLYVTNLVGTASGNLIPPTSNGATVNSASAAASVSIAVNKIQVLTSSNSYGGTVFGITAGVYIGLGGTVASALGVTTTISSIGVPYREYVCLWRIA